MSGALLLSLAVLSAAGDGRPTGFSDDQWSQLQRGEVVTRVESSVSARGATVASAVAAVVIHRPASACFAEVEHYEGLSDYLPGLTESRVLERSDASFRVHATSRMTLMHFGYGLIFQVDRAQGELRWKLDPTQPADIADTDGAWQFVPLDSGTTLLRYTIRVDSGMPVPMPLQRYFTERNLPQTLVAFRDHLQAATP